MAIHDVASRVEEILDEFRSPTSSAALTFCDRHPVDRPAFRVVDGSLGSEVITFGELASRSRRIASVLHDAGVREADRVASLMGKGADLPAMILATWRLGAVYVPLFTAFAAEAVTDRLTTAGVKVVITDDAQRHKIPEGPWSVLVAGPPGTPGGAPRLTDLADAAGEWTGQAPGGPDIPVVHMFTSGTTGKAKTVVHPKMHAAGWHSYQEFALGVTGDAAFWSGADPGWAYGLYTAIIAPLAAGTTSLLTTGTFDPVSTWEVLDRYRVTDFAAAPTALRAMRASGAQRPLPFLRHLSSAGEPLPPDVLEWTISLGVPVHDHFGQTELGMPAGFPHHPALEIPVQASAMGRSLPGWSVTVLSMDSDDEAAPDQVGRLAIDVHDSPFHTFTGYGVERNQPADRLTQDGRYYLTGDLASLDESGVLHFSSRDDDVILMAGYRIGPFEVESSLLGHPAVREVAVVAAPDKARGEVVHAFIVPSEDVTPDQDLVKTLQQWVKDTYAAHAYPRRITFVGTLPKTASGKIQRVDLRQQARTEQ